MRCRKVDLIEVENRGGGQSYRRQEQCVLMCCCADRVTTDYKELYVSQSWRKGL
jgi:hypothetical protein